jgi:hypothetical protein
VKCSQSSSSQEVKVDHQHNIMIEPFLFLDELNHIDLLVGSNAIETKLISSAKLQLSCESHSNTAKKN